MGEELSLPCGKSEDVEENYVPKVNNSDIVEEVMKGKLQKDQIIYYHVSSSENMTSKLCLVKSSNLEGFFSNRNLLILESKAEKNIYFNSVHLCNLLNQDSKSVVILQYKKSDEEDEKSNYYYTPVSSSSTKKIIINDYNAIYKVETINFISNKADKIKEQILNDLYSQLKKEYIFYGIIVDGQDKSFKNSNINTLSVSSITPTPNPNNSFNSYSNYPYVNYKNYKILYKKSKLTDNLDIKYTVDIFNGKLTKESINEILSKNKDKTLKSVICENNLENNFHDSYFFIFVGNKITPQYDDADFSVVKIDKDKLTIESFLKDITEKINLTESAKLLCIINDNKGFFLVFKYTLGDMEDDDEGY